MRVEAGKAENANAGEILSPAEHIVPALAWVDVFVCDGKHAVGIVRYEGLHFGKYVADQVLFPVWRVSVFCTKLMNWGCLHYLDLHACVENLYEALYDVQ